MGGNDETFQQLYPDQYYDSYLMTGLRPDGRPIGQARETTVGLGPVSSAISSAIVKIGETTVISGVKLSVMNPTDESPEEGKLHITVDIHPISSSQAPGKPQNRAAVLMPQLQLYLHGPNVLDLTELCIQKSSAAWSLQCEICVLVDDGALLDACLLAAVTALSSVQLPSVCVMANGQVVPANHKGATPGSVKTGHLLALRAMPLSFTCGIRGRCLIADPTLEEESLLDSQTAVVLDQDGNVLGLHKPGGAPMSDEILQDCVETSKLRYKVVSGLVAQALQAPT